MTYAELIAGMLATPFCKREWAIALIEDDEDQAVRAAYEVSDLVWC